MYNIFKSNPLIYVHSTNHLIVTIVIIYTVICNRLLINLKKKHTFCNVVFIHWWFRIVVTGKI